MYFFPLKDILSFPETQTVTAWRSAKSNTRIRPVVGLEGLHARNICVTNSTFA